jgi:hypothetical protein
MKRKKITGMEKGKVNLHSNFNANLMMQFIFADGNAKRKRKLTPEQLAMGEQMIYSRKKARELEEWAWNR